MILRPRRVLAVLLLAGLSAPAAGQEHSLNVTATAYNSTPAQTDGDPLVGAWGDRLDHASRRDPDVRIIAVSRDLIGRGLERGQLVKIKGLKGKFVVLDKMPSRWTNRIDLYMGGDIRAARRWGKRRVKIMWRESPAGAAEAAPVRSAAAGP